MAQINAYTPSAVAAANQASVKKASKNTLDMQDFMTLLSTQLSNQDVMNPMDDTQFIAQMAQFSSLQAMQTLTEISYAQYGASMLGKNVIVAKVDERGGYVEDRGTVEAVRFTGGDCMITVNGQDYPMSAVMEVVDSPIAPTAPAKPETETETETEPEIETPEQQEQAP